MKGAEGKRQRSILSVLISIGLIALVFFLLRGPYLSNTIKRVILPILEDVTGESIVSDNAVINLFPFYFQIKSLRVHDREGNRLLWVTKSRAYVDLLALLSGEFKIRRLTLIEPRLKASQEKIDQIISHLQSRMSGGKEGMRFSVGNIIATNGEYVVTRTGKIGEMSGSGISADILVKKQLLIKVNQKKGALRIDERPEMRYELKAKVAVANDGQIKIEELVVSSEGSHIRTEGEVTLTDDGKLERGSLMGEAKILQETVNTFFGLTESRGGELTASGDVHLLPSPNSKWPSMSLEVDSEGWFYLESLMEILGVRDNVKGRLTAEGHISGIYPELAFEGRGRLDRSEFGRLPVDDANCSIFYEDRKFLFQNISARVYDGDVRGKATIAIPHGDYSIRTSLKDIDSLAFFEFIGWNAPFKQGGISGYVDLEKSHGRSMHIMADVTYYNSLPGADGIIGRIEEFEGGIEYDESEVTITDGVFRTKHSMLSMEGTVDLINRQLELSLGLDSEDIGDITSRAITFIKSPVRFTGTVTGMFSDPAISGTIAMGPGTLHGMPFSEVSGDLLYQISSLSTEALHIDHGNEHYGISGSIFFRKAEEMFSFEDPYYQADIKMENAPAGSLLKTFYKDVPVSGIIRGSIRLHGDGEGLKGESTLFVEDGAVYGQRFDGIDIISEFDPEKISITSAVGRRGDSRLQADGFIAFDDHYQFSASSEDIFFHDVDLFNACGCDARMQMIMNGAGTFDNPAGKFSLNIKESSIRGNQIGRGAIEGSLQKSTLDITGTALGGIIRGTSVIRFSEKTEWDLDLQFTRGKYDPLFAALLNADQEDISASVIGATHVQAVAGDLTMQSRLTSATLNLYGYHFTNNGDIVLELDDGRLRFTSFNLSGEEGEVDISGSMRTGKDFNIQFEGNLYAVPLKSLYRGISSLKGKGDFSVGIVGPWSAPNIKGQIELQDATVAMNVFPYRIGPLNGTIFLKDDRFTFDSLKTAVAGGRVDLSGAGFFSGLSLKKLFVSAGIDGVKIRPAEGVRATLDGNLFYETSLVKSSLSGDVDIRKARYEQRFEWKTWLLGLKEKGSESMHRSSFYSNTELNIHISGDEEIVIDNNIARAPVALDLTVTGTFAKYGFVGKIEANQGKVYFRSNEFDILFGRLDFVEPHVIEPVFHIQAETFARGYRIKLNLDGSVDNLAMALYSDPPLSDADILTLLTSGRISSEESGFAGGIAAGEATAVLTGSLQDVLESEVKELTGIERFEITPQTTVTGALSPRVTIGKRFMDDKLFVVYSTSVGTTEENIIKLEYDLTRNISVEGSQNELGSTGMDLKYRYEFD